MFGRHPRFLAAYLGISTSQDLVLRSKDHKTATKLGFSFLTRLPQKRSAQRNKADYDSQGGNSKCQRQGVGQKGWLK